MLSFQPHSHSSMFFSFTTHSRPVSKCNQQKILITHTHSLLMTSFEKYLSLRYWFSPYRQCQVETPPFFGQSKQFINFDFSCQFDGTNGPNHDFYPNELIGEVSLIRFWINWLQSYLQHPLASVTSKQLSRGQQVYLDVNGRETLGIIRNNTQDGYYDVGIQDGTIKVNDNNLQVLKRKPTVRLITRCMPDSTTYTFVLLTVQYS